MFPPVTNLGRALVFFGVLGLLTLGVAHFMHAVEGGSTWQLALCGVAALLGSALMVLGGRKHPLPEGYAVIGLDLALPMSGWSLVPGRGWTDGPYVLTAATLHDPTPELSSEEELATYAARLASARQAPLLGHSRDRLQNGLEVVCLELQVEQGASAQIAIPRGRVTQLVAVAHTTQEGASSRRRWILDSLLDLKR